MEILTDSTIVNLLQNPEPAQQDRALNHLYSQYYGMIESMVLDNNGSREQVKDIFQEGIIVLFNMVRKEDFELKSKLKTLLYSICRNKWLMVLRKEKRNTSLEDKHDFIPVEDDHFNKILVTEKKKIIIELLEKLGKECKKTLQLFYYERVKMIKIAEIMGLASEAVAKNKKSNCMKQLRRMVLENPHYLKNLK